MILKMLKTIRYFRRAVYSGILKVNDALEKQINLKNYVGKFKESKKLKTPEKKKIKNWLLKTQLDFSKEDKVNVK